MTKTLKRLLGVSYRKKNTEPVLQNARNDGFVRRLLHKGPDTTREIYLYRSGWMKVLMIPRELLKPSDTPDWAGCVATYYSFLRVSRLSKKGDYSKVADQFNQDVHARFPRDFWVWRIRGYALDDKELDTEDVPGKRGNSQDKPPVSTISLKSYLVVDPEDPAQVGPARALSTRPKGGEEQIELDADEVFKLCQARVDIEYVQQQAEPSETNAILLVIAYKGANDKKQVVGIRATQVGLHSGAATPFIHGVYACSSGYGRLIQAKTEDLLRSTLAPLLQDRAPGYGTSAYTLRNTRKRKALNKSKGLPWFTLFSMEKAYTYWRDVAGFEDTGKRKGKMAYMKKDVAAPDTGSRVSQTRTTEKHSTRSGSSRSRGHSAVGSNHASNTPSKT